MLLVLLVGGVEDGVVGVVAENSVLWVLELDAC